MNELKFTLVSEGPSDQALIPILSWLLRNHLPNCAMQAEWADFRRLSPVPKTLQDKIRLAVKLFPCGLLFVHRDADRMPLRDRLAEIKKAVTIEEPLTISVISVVPIRMLEAWLLFDGEAIKKAAGNPNCHLDLDLPKIAAIETLPDPKTILNNLLKEASGLHGRRRKSFSTSGGTRRIADFIEEFEPLRQLSAFQILEQSIIDCINNKGWNV
jgi:hypothetical protein